MFRGLVALLSISFVGSAKVQIQPRSCGRFHYLYLDSVFLILFKYIIVSILKGSPWWKGDNFCDDENNNAACDWDGGDCCGPNVVTYYCSECQCLDPSFASSTTASPTTAGTSGPSTTSTLPTNLNVLFLGRKI